MFKFLSLLLFLFACSPKKQVVVSEADLWNQAKVSIQEGLPIDSTDIVFIGTSLTEAFPVAELFQDCKIKNRGIAGNRSRHILNRLPFILSRHPKKIFLEMGVNDFQDGVSVDSVYHQYERSISLIRSASVPVVVQSVFPVRGRYGKMNTAITQLNTRLEKKCDSVEVPYVDVYSFLSSWDSLDGSKTFDGLHLNAKGYKEWKDAIEKYIR